MAPSTVVLITGANSGVGLAAAKVIASSSDKYHVIVTGRTIEKAQAAVEEIKALGSLKGTVSALQLDVTDAGSVESATKAVEDGFGRLDVLVNNAALGFTDLSVVESFRALFETNVIGPFNTAKAFRPLLQKSKDPRSVFVSSGMGSIAGAKINAEIYTRFGEAGIPYSVSKSALNMLAVQEKIVFPDDQTKVFLFCPGFVVSNLRGKDEESRNGWGGAGDPTVSGQTLLSIIEGKRDEDEIKGTIHKDGVYPW